VLVHAADRFRRGDGPIELGTLSRELDVDSGVVAQCVAKLCDLGALVAIDEDEEAFVLGRDAETIGLSSIADQFGGACTPAGADPRVVALLAEIEDERRRGLARQTLADLVAFAPDAPAPSSTATMAEPLVARSAGERA
jgi:DNA-binding IscR family transcriptional regulator